MKVYQPKAFQPPCWTRLGGHFQTIFGSIFPIPNIRYDKRRRFFTPDGDFFDVDIVFACDKQKPYVVVCHGLESSAHSSHSLRIVESFAALDWNVFAINYRGCSGVPNRTLRTYHVGFTEDLELLTKTIYEETEGSCTIYLAGFSLGGNIIIKFLGELGSTAYERRILGAAVACVPLNPFYCQPKADRGISKWIYVRRFLSSFKQKAEEQHNRFAKALDIQRLRKITTIGELDDYYISKVFGFNGKEDYYRKNGGEFFLPFVRVPLLVLQSKNDPIVDTEHLPCPQLFESLPIHFLYTEYGGHCGYFNGFFQPSYMAQELSHFLLFVNKSC
ncbi:hypothetical protein GpartN1_g5514.t1 [Galdieria partita]|uniref:Serine aminopeptidase S33 domain-containing protein n=1 Tax=Galdieria partita TaxID=83374 RepID=A0A9C7PZE8_9RHOD|nr:hypothetical protein GpartN1_g5514.t1 [Galdieria partita]